MSLEIDMKKTSLVPEIKEYKVSSVINDDRKVYGKKFLFDGKDETCWNSDQGLPQWIHFKFPTPKTIKVLKLQFQGGFAGKDCELEAISKNKAESKQFRFIPDDSNKVQEFTTEPEMTSDDFQLTFRTTTDFYGRLIIYQFDIIGS